jgi:hypothetical protein
LRECLVVVAAPIKKEREGMVARNWNGYTNRKADYQL